jgi:hypothetical protein
VLWPKDLRQAHTAWVQDQEEHPPVQQGRQAFDLAARLLQRSAIVGVSPNVVVRYLPLMLFDIARQWINDLAENSIQTWFDMQIAFNQTSREPKTDLTTSETSNGAGGQTTRPPELSLRGGLI